MTEAHTDDGAGRVANDNTHTTAAYSYEAAGISENEGHVPLWLWLVVVTLLIWGIYYLVTYWNAPVTPT